MRWTALTVFVGLMAAPTAQASECFQLAEAPAPKLHHASFTLAEDEVAPNLFH